MEEEVQPISEERNTFPKVVQMEVMVVAAVI
jgi:hypothetical protein